MSDQKKLRVTDFAQSVFYVNGRPMKITRKDHRHLYAIYNKPSNAKILKFGRQTHKSTTDACLGTVPMLKYPNYHVLYIAPTGNQVSVFSNDKLKGTLQSSDIITKHFMDSHTTDQVTFKELSNGSKIYLRSAFHSADASRGISADMCIFDEIQDLVADHIPVIEQCMSHSLPKWAQMKEDNPNLPMHLFNSKVYSGTPKTLDNTLERYWNISTQNEWIVKCTGCNKENYLCERNIGKTGLICSKCGKPLLYDNGRWVAMKSEGTVMDGYRMPQIAVNWINNPLYPEIWETNVIKTQKSYSIEKYYNEILALPYANAKHPLNEHDMEAVCGDKPIFREDGIDPSVNKKGTFPFITAGIDWGKGDTMSGTSYSVLTIMAWHKRKPTVLFMKKYKGRMSEPLIQIEDMLRIIYAFGAQLTIADMGDGRTSNAIMVDKLGPGKFAELYEHGTLATKIKWNSDSGYYIINRTQVMTDFFMEITRGQVSFFRWADFKDEFLSDFTSICAEYSEQTRMIKYDHNLPDDAFHSYLMARVAMAVKTGEYAKFLTGTAADVPSVKNRGNKPPAGYE